MTLTYVDKVRKYQEFLLSTNIYVIDVETTLISKDKYKTVYNTPPEYIVHALSNVVKPKVITLRNHKDLHYIFRNLSWNNMYVGHNITYDMFIGATWDLHTFSTHGFIWDTMLAEYLLTNQIERMPSLEQSCANYGIAMVKGAEVAEAMKAGICPSTLPPEQLDAYLEQDINMTKELFIKQKIEFYKRPVEWQVMFINQMFFLVNTLRASVNGMKIDKQYVEHQKLVLWADVGRLEKDLKQFMGRQTSTDPAIWNPASNTDLTVFLYGGTKKWDDRVPNGVYKTGASVGKTKYKIEKRQFVRCPIFESRGSVDVSALKDMLRSTTLGGTGAYAPFLEKLIEYKDMNKNLNTYFEGYMNHATGDGYIKPKYNHGLTPTGRLTCSGPNLQNIKA